MQKPKKSLGQHWLTDYSTLKRIANAGLITKTDTVLEIGPGTGSLTEILLSHADRLVVVEIDAELISSLKNKFINRNIEIINQDFLKYNLDRLGPYKIVANIPYLITGKVLRKIIDTSNKPSVAVLLLQKEVAEQLCAEIGKRSLLGVLVQHYFDIEPLFVISADKFMPVPKVDSRAVRFHLRDNPVEVDYKKFAELIKKSFATKRKTLLNNLASGYQMNKGEARDLVKNTGALATTRAQELTDEQWYKLLEAVCKKGL